MIQVDLFKLKDFFKKYYAHIVAIILFVMLFKGCNSDSVFKEDIAAIKKENILLKKVVNSVLKENESKDKEIVEHKKAISFLDTQNQKRQQEIFDLANKNRELKSSVNKYTPNQLVKFYIDRYKQPKDVFKTNLGITFKDTLSKVIALDLVDYDFTSKELSISKEIITDKDKVISLKDTIINNLEYQKKNLNFVVQEQGLLVDNQEDLIDKQEKVIKKNSRNNKLLKTSIPIVAILSILAGVLIAK